MELYIILFGWVIYYIVWLVLARQVNLVKLTNPLPFREGIIWCISWSLTIVLLIGSKNTNWTVNYLYVICFYLSFCSALITRYQLGENWKPFAAKESSYRIINRGMYKYLRHPLYFWQFLMVLFTAFSFQKLIPAIIFIFIPTVANRLRAQSERDMLLDKYPVEYTSYRSKTFWGIAMRKYFVIDFKKRFL